MNIKKYWTNFKTFNFGLFIALCCLALVPALYGTIRTMVISTNIPVAEFDILGQMEWFDLINETLLAFLIIPLYSILNHFYKKDQTQFKNLTFKSCLLTFSLYLTFSVFVYFYGEHLIRAMDISSENVIQTRSYFQLETIGFIFGFFLSFSNIIFVVVNKKRNIYILLCTKFILTIFSDLCFIPWFGVNGVGYSNILINGILAIVCITLLFCQKQINITWFRKEDCAFVKSWLKKGFFSGVQSFIDNIIYILMIAKMVNMVQEQGNYWVANNFIWTWLLIPVLALGEIIKGDCKERYTDLKQSNYYNMLVLIVLTWICLFPTWSFFFQNIEKLENYRAIFDITSKLFWFYIAYALTIVPDSIFIGLGKMKYLFINSLLVNFIYYGTFFILYKTNCIVMTMDVIILMFGCGMIVHEVISLVEEKRFLKKRSTIK